MRRLLALPLLALAIAGCPSYDSYAPLVSQKGLVPPDQFARYGKEQAQAVAVERDAMSALLIGGGVDLAEVGQMFARLTDNHSKRMALMGLTA